METEKNIEDSNKDGTRIESLNLLKIDLEMGLSTVQERRGGGDLITMYKLVNNIERIDRNDLVIQMEEGERQMRDHGKKIKKSGCSSEIKKSSFLHRTIEIWNDLKEEMVVANNVHV